MEKPKLHVTIASGRTMEAYDSDPSWPDNQRAHRVEREMDPVSATASIIGLLAIATALVKSAYTVSSTAKEFQNEWTSIANEAAQLLGVITALQPPLRVETDQAPLDNSDEVSPPSPRNSTSSQTSPLSTPSEKDYDVVSIRRTREYLEAQLGAEVAICRITLMELQQLLLQSQPTVGQRISNARKQVLWPLRKPDFQKLLDRLTKHRATFVLILSTQGT